MDTGFTSLTKVVKGLIRNFILGQPQDLSCFFFFFVKRIIMYTKEKTLLNIVKFGKEDQW